MEKEKLTIVFTEDEKIIRNALISEIDWQSLGVGILLEASDAEELFALTQVNHIDIVFMDINMPRMNGIEASKLLRKRNPDIHIIILTSYNDFEFVREGLRLGIDEYLLKPINKEEVIAAIHKVRKEIEEKRMLDKHYSEMEMLLEQSRHALMQKKYQTIIYEHKSHKEIVKEMESLSFPIRSNYIQAASILISHGKTNGTARRRYIEDVRNAVGTYFHDMHWISIFSDDKNHIVMINNNERMSLEEECIKFLNDYKEDQNWTLYIGVSNIYWDIAKISDAYYETLKALEYRACVGRNRCICYADIDEKDNSVTKINIEQFQPVEMAIRLGNSKEALELLKNMWTGNETGIMVSLDVLHSEAAIFMNQILKIAEVYNVADIFELAAHNFYKEIYEIENINNMLDFFSEHINSVITKISECANMNKKNHLKEIVAYIDQHVQDASLSLTKLSEHFFMNASYLSRALKEYLGCNFSDYCCKQRIELAMKLLLESDKKVYEIAEEVGFGDAKYFSACFKKNTGITVNDYRAKYKEKRYDSEI